MTEKEIRSEIERLSHKRLNSTERLLVELAKCLFKKVDELTPRPIANVRMEAVPTARWAGMEDE